MILRLAKSKKKRRRYLRPEEYTFLQSFSPLYFKSKPSN